MIRAFFTPDIPSDVRQNLVDAWAPFHLRSAGEIHRKGALDLPGFIKLIGEAADWLPLKAAAAIFLSQLAKEAATDIYKHKAAIARALGEVAAAPIRTVAQSLLRARLDSGSAVPGVVLGLSIPNDFFGTSIDLDAMSEEEIAVVVSKFVTRAEEIEAIIKAEIVAGNPPMGSVLVSSASSGGFTLSWLDRSMKQHERQVN